MPRARTARVVVAAAGQKDSGAPDEREVALRRKENKEHQTKYRERRKREREEFDTGSAVDPREQRRAEVLSGELARSALLFGSFGGDEDGVPWKPAVAKFREEFLEGRVISSAEAKQFRESDAVYVLRLSEFRGHGIPVIGHTSKREGRIGGQFDREPIQYTFRFTIRWGRESTIVEADRFASKTLEECYVPPPPDWRGPTVLRESVFALLLDLSARLARHYLWTVDDAINFVLTGAPPPTPCIRARRELPARSTLLHEHERLHLSIFPWVSARTVMKMYRQYQLELLKRDNRAPRLDRLDLLEFVAQRRHRGQTWRKIFEAWNKAHPEQDKQPQHLRNFQRDFAEIYRHVIGEEPLFGPAPSIRRRRTTSKADR